LEAIEKFRIETREWLEANCLDSMRTPQPENEVVWGGRNASFKNPDSKVWLERMAERGWTAPMWPKQYGGGGLNKTEFKILREEMAALKCRSPLASFGLSMLGPVLLEFADEQQKMEHLPKIVKGEIRWCQGYSEPGSGSDLAGLQTRAFAVHDASSKVEAVNRSEDLKEGALAFAEKREPVWKGN
jgi:alkylation response protein AidB-like acyl-CoA dehydrogenase